MNDQIAAKAAELRALVELQGKAGKDPLHTTMALAALDAFIPPASDAARAQPPNQLGLSPGEARVASTFSDLFSKLDRQAKVGSDAQKLAGLLTDAADSLSAMAAVRISYAGLCQRVESFGRFEPFPSMSFLAGRSHRAIVYVELDRFSARPAISADGSQAQGNAWVVEVSQELELIHDADGRQQWYRPPQTVVDSSRTRRRDFYLVNTIELPATLSVGAYSLKVTIRDKTGGSTDERVIPLQVIADASATQSPRSVSLQK